MTHQLRDFCPSIKSLTYNTWAQTPSQSVKCSGLNKLESHRFLMTWQKEKEMKGKEKRDRKLSGPQLPSVNKRNTSYQRGSVLVLIRADLKWLCSSRTLSWLSTSAGTQALIIKPLKVGSLAVWSLSHGLSLFSFLTAALSGGQLWGGFPTSDYHRLTSNAKDAAEGLYGGNVSRRLRARWQYLVSTFIWCRLGVTFFFFF